MTNETLKHILIEKIIVNPFQPRKQFCDEGIEELALSIKSIGIIQPPIVKAIAGKDQFELIAGERRVRAAKKAGLSIIPVIVKVCSHHCSAEAALIENIQRIDLNPIETAEAILSLMHKFNLKQEEVAERVGKKRSTIANYLRLLSLPKIIQEAVLKNSISMGHAKVILSLNSPEKQINLCDKIIQEHLSVRLTEKFAHLLSSPGPSSPKTQQKNDSILDLETRLQQSLGTKVKIVEKSNQTGQLCIDYYSLDDLDRLLALFIS